MKHLIYNIYKVYRYQNLLKYKTYSSTKTRSNIKGSGKKPWKQKGTGKARAGSIRSPLWRGGAVTFGPLPHITKYKINKKEKKLAVLSTFFVKKFQIILIKNLDKFLLLNSKLLKQKYLKKIIYILNNNININLSKILISLENNLNYYKFIFLKNLFNKLQLTLSNIVKSDNIILSDTNYIHFINKYLKKI